MNTDVQQVSRRRHERLRLEATFRTVREALEKRGSGQGVDPALSAELRAAPEEMDVMWDEIQTQSRLISRDRRRYARFFQHMPDACVVTTPAGRISETNRAAVQLLGVPSGSLPGRALASFLSAADRGQFSARLAVIDNDGDGRGSAPWKATLQPAVGQPVPVTLSLRAVQHAGGEVAELCWLIRQIQID
jgi:PAS domain S-box-containing protein